MARQVECKKLGRLATALEQIPFPGELGQRIYESISQEAWRMWLSHQTMLINEYRLNPLELQTRTFLAQEREKFLFNGGSEHPPGYVSAETVGKSDKFT